MRPFQDAVTFVFISTIILMADAFCSIDVEDYVQRDCGIDKAGIVAVAFIDPDAYSDEPSTGELETDSFWTDMQSASPPQVYIATKTRGEYQGGTPTEEEGFGQSSTQVTGANHELMLEFEGLEENRDFVEGVNRRKWRLAFITSGNKLGYVHNPVTPYFSPKIAKAIASGAFWGGSIKWQDYSNPVFVDAPNDVFEE